MEVFQPSAVMLQCGADSLSGDKLGCFNVTMNGHAACVQFVRSFNVPFILLGGGFRTLINFSVVASWGFYFLTVGVCSDCRCCSCPDDASGSWSCNTANQRAAIGEVRELFRRVLGLSLCAGHTKHGSPHRSRFVRSRCSCSACRL